MKVINAPGEDIVIRRLVGNGTFNRGVVSY